MAVAQGREVIAATTPVTLTRALPLTPLGPLVEEVLRQ